MFRILRVLCCTLLVVCLSFIPALCSAEQRYQITETELERLDRNLTYQRQAEDRVRDIEKTTGSVADAIDGSRKTVSDAQGAAGRIEADAGRAGAVIAECQQIIAAVRTRGTVKAP